MDDDEDFYVPSTPFLMGGSVLVVTAFNLELRLEWSVMAALVALALAVMPAALKARRRSNAAAGRKPVSGEPRAAVVRWKDEKVKVAGGASGSWLGACCSAREDSPVGEQPRRRPTTEQLRDPELCLTRPDEREAMADLLRELSQELRSAPQWADLVGERRLLRFYRGHGTVPAAVKAYRSMLAWREETGADALRESVAKLPWSADQLPWLGLLRSVIPLDIEAGRTPEGHLVTLELTGRLDAQRFMQIPDADFRNSYNSMMELRTRVLDEMSEAQGRLIKVTQVRDLRGFSNVYGSLIRNAGAMARLKGVVSDSLCAHPESMNRVVLLNVPKAFYSLFAIVSPLLTERMKKKITFESKPHDPKLVFEVGGPEALLRLARLAAPDAVCPGKSARTVQADDFFELAVPVPAGATLRWEWSASDVEFSVADFPGTAGAHRDGPCGMAQVWPPQRCSVHEGRHQPRRTSVCLLRWSNVHSWYADKDLSYSISVQ